MLSPYHYAAPGGLMPDSPPASPIHSLTSEQRRELVSKLSADIERWLNSLNLNEREDLLLPWGSRLTARVQLRELISESWDSWAINGSEFSAELHSKTASDGEEEAP